MAKPALLFFLAVFLLGPIPASFSQPIDHSKWDQILKTHVRDGRVDYEQLALRRSQLDEYLKQLEDYSIDLFSHLSREERIAFWINLYNASVLRIVLDEYPVTSLSDIPAAREVRTIHAIGEFFSLSELFDQVFRNGFRDERILTALVSARMDSPKLLEEAFEGVRLEEQLDRAAREFVSDDSRNQIKPGSKNIFLSPLLKQYGSDFLLNYSSARESRYSPEESAVVSFFLNHLSDPEKRIFLDSARYDIEYLPEDPRLNAVSMSKIPAQS